MVGASGFEPPASWSRTRRASQAALRPEDTHPGARIKRPEWKIQNSIPPGLELEREAKGGTGFSLWPLVLARTNPHSLKPAPLQPCAIVNSAKPKFSASSNSY